MLVRAVPRPVRALIQLLAVLVRLAVAVVPAIQLALARAVRVVVALKLPVLRVLPGHLTKVSLGLLGTVRLAVVAVVVLVRPGVLGPHTIQATGLLLPLRVLQYFVLVAAQLVQLVLLAVVAQTGGNQARLTVVLGLGATPQIRVAQV